jgi:predicted transposase YdaD
MGGENILEASWTYQEILNEGRTRGKAEGKAEGALEAERNVLLIQGRKKFGAPPPDREASLAAITDRARLQRMAERIFDATGWDDLLATP